jgi:hypothetical protein
MGGSLPKTHFLLIMEFIFLFLFPFQVTSELVEKIPKIGKKDIEDIISSTLMQPWCLKIVN